MIKKNYTHRPKENWTKEETRKYLHAQAEKQSRKNKESRKGKKFRLVKVCDHPATYKEIEVKN